MTLFRFYQIGQKAGRLFMAGGMTNECTFYGEQMTPEELTITCKEFPDFAMREEGFGDLSIIRAYERYKMETPAISRIWIWSLDNHLKAYDETLHKELRIGRKSADFLFTIAYVLLTR